MFSLFMIAHKVQCLCCLVFPIVFLVLLLFVKHVVCKICKSFNRKTNTCFGMYTRFFL